MAENQKFKTIDETWRERLNILIDKFGSQKQLADMANISPNQISQWRTSAIAGTGKPRKMSVESARRLEESLNLPRGWMDQPITQNNTADQMQVSNNYGNGDQNTTFYNLIQEKQKHSESNKLKEEAAGYLKTMPLLDIDTGIDFAINPEEHLKKIKEYDNRASTFIPHSSYTFGVKMPDDSIRDITAERISKNDILIIEPKIEPRHGDLILVGLNYNNPSRRRGLVARCDFDLSNNIKIKYSNEPPADLPEGALICGVIVEIKRRLIPIDTINSRLDVNWDIKTTLKK